MDMQKGIGNMNKIKKICSLLLAIILTFSSLPVSALAETINNDATTIRVESYTAAVGEDVNVDIVIENNPGILGATLEITFDESLTLVSATAGEAFSYLTMTRSGELTSPCRFVWDGQECNEEDIKDGVILTLSFDVAENAEIGKNLEIAVSAPGNDILDNNLNPVDVNLVNGSITVLDFMAGDVNGDNKISVADVILIRRHIVGGYGTDINENAANVNDDGKVSSADIILIRRYIAGGYGVELLTPSTLKCSHSMEKTDYVAPTCTEDGNIDYWYCMNCHKFFSDEQGGQEIEEEDTILSANGHTVVVDPAVEPTYDSTGLTEGSHCSVCNEVLQEQVEIPMLKKDEYSIQYFVANGDSYLQGLNIDNPNPSVYTKQDGLELVGLNEMVDGYIFLGWYTEPEGGTRITSIPVGNTGNLDLYAHWSKEVYKITFDSPDIPVEKNPIEYTVDTGMTLNNLSWNGYTFVGWSNDDGFIVNSIKPGTTGHMTLHANWTSNRNRATSYSKYGEPIIIEDNENGQFLFVYDIGRIDNVPLNEITYLGNVLQTLDYSQDHTLTDAISQESAKTIANVVANATTRSSGWTLSKEWNQIYEEGTTDTVGQVKSEERTDSEGNTVGGNYFVSNSEGGSSYVSTESGSSSSSSSKVTTNQSYGINKSYDDSTETYGETRLDVKKNADMGTEMGFELEVPISVAELSVGVTNTANVSSEENYQSVDGRKSNEAYHADSSESNYVGTVKINEASSFVNVSANNSSNWNSTSGYENSYQTSRNSAVTEAISTAIEETTTYNLSTAIGTDNCLSESVAGTQERSEEYSSTVLYGQETTSSETKTMKHYSEAAGYYRIVSATTIYVYGVVGYDVATSSYYTYTFNIPSAEVRDYLDYSKDNSDFTDCENGLVTFKIPFEVYEYISGVTGKTTGLEFDLDGVLTGIDTELNPNFDGTVMVPQYYSIDHGDGTYSAHKTKQFNADTFRGNTSIKTVILPTYITEIPDNAFEGCTNLETVVAYGVSKIGSNAFKGCTSLGEFYIDNFITSLGTNAFEGAPEINVMAANTAVADAALNSGAKRITLNISKLGTSYDNKKISISDSVEYFALIGGGASYSNLFLESNATETFISNIKFVNSTNVPLKLDSETVTLARVSVENCSSLALVLLADHTNLKLLDTIKLGVTGEDAVISKNVTLGKSNVEVSGLLQLTGNYLVCGEISNDNLLSFNSGKVITITEDEYNNRLTSCTVSFNANGGSTPTASKTVYYGQKYGTLPTPTRTYYTFNGWYTAASGGTKVTADTVVDKLVNHTLYAQWSLNTYTLKFNANGGSVSQTSKVVTCGQAVGTLPTPSRTGYTFTGWYTSDGTKLTSTSILSTQVDVTVTAKWSVNSYKVSWNAGTGYTITVKRTSSPNANAGTGTLSSGATIYYGDVLAITYTAKTGYTFNSKGITSATVTGNITSSNIYATASVNQYTVSWNTGTGYSITVKRTSSPLAGASTGTLNSGAKVYYGDVLSITYSASTGYSLSSKGKTSITVTSNVTSSSIYATASLNSYTYNIVYKSSNGTSLGTATATYKYGTTNTITPKSISGYNTPASQSVAWNSTSAKTITFVYTPVGVATSQAVASGSWWSTASGYTYINYSANVEFQNRTANSVQLRVVWTNTMTAKSSSNPGRYGYGQYFNASANGVGTGDVTICTSATWASAFSGTKSQTAYSGWITVPLNTTNVVGVTVSGSWWDQNSKSGSWSGSITIPAY